MICSLDYSSHILCTRNQRVIVSQDIENIQFTILSMHGLGQRHTAQTFGRDSAAISPISHTDWLSVACPCRLTPIQSHEMLRTDSIEGQGPGFLGVGDAARVAGLGERKSEENVMLCVFLSLPAISLH